MSSHIRFARPSDHLSIEKIENEADQLLIDFLSPSSWDEAPNASSRASEPGFMLVLETEEMEVVGFIHVIEADGIAHLEQVSVDPSHGRRGYGGDLVNAAKAEAHRRGYQRLTLRTYSDVPWNRPFYERHGFVEELPVTPFHKNLLGVEAKFRLEKWGRRVQMFAELP